MTAQLPPHICPQSTPTAGTTLYTSKAIPAGELIFQVERPLAYALNAIRLRDTCAGCFVMLNANAVEAQEKGTNLKSCLGCKVVGYCSKACQVTSWKAQHKYECKIFNKLRPKTLPNAVQMVMQLLQRRKAGAISDDEWNGFLSLQTHIDEFKFQDLSNADGAVAWEAIQLMSQAASSYCGSQEPLPFVQTIAARVLLNSHTLTTPTQDGIGMYLSVPASLLNHSCEPNAALTFSLHGRLSIRSLSAIPASTSLTIAYVDTTLPTPSRRAELLKRYHFSCVCPSCTKPLSDTATPKPRPEFDHLFKADSQAGLPDLLRAYSALRPTFKPYQHPMPQLHHQIYLAAVDAGCFHLALTHSLVRYYLIDPILCPSSYHPLRVVHAWVLFRLMTAITTLNQTPTSLMNGGFTAIGGDLDPAISIAALWHEVRSNVTRSHGDDSAFADEVRELGTRTGVGLVAKDFFSEGDEKRERRKLRALAEKEYEDQKK